MKRCGSMLGFVMVVVTLLANGKSDGLKDVVKNSGFGVWSVLALHPNVTIRLLTSKISSEFRFVVFQAHSQIHPIVMSQSNLQRPPHGTYVESRSPGLVTLLELEQQSAFIYLRSKAATVINVLVKIDLYTHSDPIPGGCNMEFDISIAPYLRMWFNPYMTTVEYQRARIGYRRGERPVSCDASYGALQYNVYVYHLSENSLSEEKYFEAIKVMATVDSIVAAAEKVEPLFGLSHLRFDLTTYRRQGIAVNIVVKDKYNNLIFSTPYVPSITYGCQLTGNNDSCIDFLTPFEWIMSVFAALFGIFLTLVGHRFFKIATASFGFMSSSLIAYILLTLYTQLSYPGIVSSTFVIGVLGGLLWVLFWWFGGNPITITLLPGFDLGFLIACIIMFTPLGYISVFQSNLNYWTVFACIILIVPILLIRYVRLLHIMACTIIGSYAVIVLLDSFASGSLKYILINVIRRATIPKYNNVINLMPFQTADISLTCLWVFLTVLGMAIQIYRERKRPPFPLSPYCAQKILRRANVTVPTAPEAEPLLNQQNYRPGYRSTSRLDPPLI